MTTENRADDDAIEIAILAAAQEAGANRAEAILRLVDLDQIESDPDGPMVGAKRAVLEIRSNYPDMFLRSREATLSHSERSALRESDDLALVVEAIRPYIHLLSPGVDLALVAREMIDTARMTPQNRDETIGRRLMRPSPYSEKFGLPDSGLPQAQSSIPRFSRQDPVRPPYLQDQDETGGDLIDLDQHNPFVEATKLASNYRM